MWSVGVQCYLPLQVWSHILGDINGWQFGQVQLLASTRFQVVFEGVSFNGGFTLDDFKVYMGTCASEWCSDTLLQKERDFIYTHVKISEDGFQSVLLRFHRKTTRLQSCLLPFLMRYVTFLLAEHDALSSWVCILYSLSSKERSTMQTQFSSLTNPCM